jgi:hypothetical protein
MTISFRTSWLIAALLVALLVCAIMIVALWWADTPRVHPHSWLGLEWEARR